MSKKSNDDVSKEAKDKAEHLKREIEKIKGQRLKYSRERRKRAAQLEMKLQDETHDTDSKRAIQIQYFLDESHSLRETRSNGLKTLGTDFAIVKIIGKGAFGEVRIVRHKKSGQVFAMKAMQKSMMEAKNQLGHIADERDIMADADNPFLVTLFYAFQDAQYLYLVMEFCGGGDLMGLLIKKDILSDDETRFYMAELAVAINYVHELGYVHRDLKPDNVLVANDGHIRLADFGLAKSFKNSNDSQLDNWQQFVSTLAQADIQKLKDDEKEQNQGKVEHKKVYSTVGTPDYIALEVLYQKGYDKMVDWWSLGVIMFECLCGYAPFHADGPLETCRKIVRYERYFKIPKGMKLNKLALDLMNKLVCPMQRRLGWDKIPSHPWFKKHVDWKNLETTKPPFVPNMDAEDSAKYFDDSIEQEFEMNDEDTAQQSGWSSAAENNNKLFAYTYTRKQGQELTQKLKNNK